MTPKEKAKELVDKYLDIDSKYEYLSYSMAKQCALIAVVDILNLGLHSVGDYRNDQASSDDFSTVTWYINYWQEVKQEIEEL